MTEKRFTLSDDVGMLDVACGNIFDNGEFVGTVQLCDGDNIVALLNEQHETITTLNNQLNNFKLHSKDLEEENKLLKEALREELQDNGNAYYIKIFDKLFNLNYDEWDNNERYRESMDWEEQLQLKELSDLYD